MCATCRLFAFMLFNINFLDVCLHIIVDIVFGIRDAVAARRVVEGGEITITVGFLGNFESLKLDDDFVVGYSVKIFDGRICGTNVTCDCTGMGMQGMYIYKICNMTSIYRCTCMQCLGHSVCSSIVQPLLWFLVGFLCQSKGMHV